MHTNLRTAGRLGAFCVLMLGFGYALVPLYDILCDITGLSGSTSNLTRVAEKMPETTPVDPDREVVVQFTTTLNQSMPWDFRPDQFEMRIQPGQTYRTVFHARNRSTRDMVGQAVPSVTPIVAAPHLVKQECFCFTNQPLEAGAQTTMPVVFQVRPDLPASVDTLTLSYTFFDITSAAQTESRTRSG